ncbi:hypothetical protein T08_12773 [Trichinella sp. T8]|nr:hypothetical protein T08_12773 [Trichinella sp. T8]
MLKSLNVKFCSGKKFYLKTFRGRGRIFWFQILPRYSIRIPMSIFYQHLAVFKKYQEFLESLETLLKIFTNFNFTFLRTSLFSNLLHIFKENTRSTKFN